MFAGIGDILAGILIGAFFCNLDMRVPQGLKDAWASWWSKTGKDTKAKA